MNATQSTFRNLARTAYMLGTILLITGLLLGLFATPAQADTQVSSAPNVPSINIILNETVPGNCSESPGTSAKIDPFNERTGETYSSDRYVVRVGIKAGAYCHYYDAPAGLVGVVADRCYRMTWSNEGRTVFVEQLDDSRTCKDISHAVFYFGDPPTPTETPVTPTDTPVTPTETPVTPTDTPVTPTETPVTPTDTPVTPTETPVTPTDTPVTPTETPVTPTDTPVTPTDTPVTPTDTPVTPTDTPVTPTDTPVTPTDTPVTPTTVTPVDTTTPEPSDTPTPVETTTTPVDPTETVVETQIGTPVTTVVPTDDPGTPEAPATLAPPPPGNNTVLIPVTGGDLSQTSPLAGIQVLFINLGLAIFGMGLVLQGFARRAA